MIALEEDGSVGSVATVDATEHSLRHAEARIAFETELIQYFVPRPEEGNYGDLSLRGPQSLGRMRQNIERWSGARGCPRHCMLVFWRAEEQALSTALAHAASEARQRGRRLVVAPEWHIEFTIVQQEISAAMTHQRA